VDDFLNRNDTIVKEKYNQLFLSLQIGGIRTMNMHKRYMKFRIKNIEENNNE
jgi:hypothetical protein